MFRANTKSPPLPILSQAAENIFCSLFVTVTMTTCTNPADPTEKSLLFKCSLWSLSIQAIYTAVTGTLTAQSWWWGMFCQTYSQKINNSLWKHTNTFQGVPGSDHCKSLAITVQLMGGKILLSRCFSETKGFGQEWLPSLLIRFPNKHKGHLAETWTRLRGCWLS